MSHPSIILADSVPQAKAWVDEPCPWRGGWAFLDATECPDGCPACGGTGRWLHPLPDLTPA